MWAGKGMFQPGAPIRDSYFFLIYDLEVKQSFPVHLGESKLMNQMHYLLLKKESLERKKSAASLKNTEMFQMQRKNAVSPCMSSSGPCQMQY